jgi:hypothetical protein
VLTYRRSAWENTGINSYVTTLVCDLWQVSWCVYNYVIVLWSEDADRQPYTVLNDLRLMTAVPIGITMHYAVGRKLRMTLRAVISGSCMLKLAHPALYYCWFGAIWLLYAQPAKLSRLTFLNMDHRCMRSIILHDKQHCADYAMCTLYSLIRCKRCMHHNQPVLLSTPFWRPRLLANVLRPRARLAKGVETTYDQDQDFE